MGGKVVVHAFAECLLAKVVLNREQHHAGLAIGNAIEHLFDFFRGISAGANRPGGGLGVEIECVIEA